MKKCLLFFVCFILITPLSSYAIDCSTASAVQTAVNGAANEATLTCTSGGTYSWGSSMVSIPNTKGITLNGNGATISGSGNNHLNGSINIAANATTSTRITNFIFPTTCAVVTSGTSTSAPFRIDHCTFGDQQDEYIVTSGNAPGLIDSNMFYGLAGAELIHNYGEGDTGWSVDVIPGSGNAVYIENNTFNFNASGYSGSTSAIQCYYGARDVFRYNNVQAMKFDNHGTAGMVGGRWWEIYNNEWTGISGGGLDTAITLRAGSGVIFNNTWTANGGILNSGIILWEEDTGTYPLLYQVGRGKNEVSFPAYIWGNDSSISSINNQSPTYIQLNRDYCLSNSSVGCNGVSGYTFTPYTCPHPLAGLTGTCNKTVAGKAGYNINGSFTPPSRLRVVQ